MPALDKLKDLLYNFYYKLTDYSWMFAEKLEKFKIPLATFCDKYKINPLFIFAGLLIAIIILLLLLFGAQPYTEATITVLDENKLPMEGAVIGYELDGKTTDATTGSNGKATITIPLNREIVISANKAGYATGSISKTFTDAELSATITISRKMGKLIVKIESETTLPSRAYIFLPEVGKKLTISANEAEVELPVGTEVTPTLKIGDFSIAGETVTIRETETEVTIDVGSVDVILTVHVVDSDGINVGDAQVSLFNDNSVLIGTKTTTYNGEAVFDVPVGSNVYATVSADSKYSQYNGYDRNNVLAVSGNSDYYVTLNLIGKVEVCVYDSVTSEEVYANVKLKNTAGSILRQDYTEDGCVSFFGLQEGDSVYPEVTADGYKTYSDSTDLQEIDYSTSISFSVYLEELSAGESVSLLFSTACQSSPVDAEVLLIDATTNEMVSEVDMNCNPTCSGTYSAESGKSYYAAAYKTGYNLARTDSQEAAQSTTFDIEICIADEDDTGGVKACAYKDGQAYEAVYELHDSYGDLIWAGEGECYTFDGLPDGMEVYVVGADLGTEELSSEIIDIVGGEIQEVNFTTGSPLFEPETGNVKVCAYDTSLNPLDALVSIYDWQTDQNLTSPTSSTLNCVVFEDIAAEINNNGTIQNRIVYAKATYEDYATYDGKAAGQNYTMVPSGTLDINIIMNSSVSVCVEAVSAITKRPVPSIISLSYESNGHSVDNIETETGRAEFSAEKRDLYYFKISENDPLLEPEDEYERVFEEVSNGSCSELQLYETDDSCGLGFEFFSENFTVNLNEDSTIELPFMLLWDAEQMSASVGDSYGTRVSLVLENGKELNATLKQEADYIPFSIILGYTRYSPDEELNLQFSPEAGYHRMTIYLENSEDCSITRQFTVNAINETPRITVTSDNITIDISDPEDESFCIYIRDQNRELVENATASYSIFQADGWSSDVTRNAEWNEFKGCYLTSIADSYAPLEGSLPVYLKARTDIAEASAQVTARITGGSSLDVSIDTFSIDASDDEPVSFCIHVASNGATVEDAQVTYALYQSDGWASDLSSSPSWDNFKNCYTGTLPDSIADEDGSFPLYAEATLNGREGQAQTTISVYNVGEGCVSDSDCEEGYICVDEECVPENESNITSLSISVQSATIEIGSNTTTSFCIDVKDQSGQVVKTADVTYAAFISDGWASDHQGTAAYNTFKKCYLATLSYTVVPRISGEYPVFANAQLNDLSVDGSGTITVINECSCDETRECEEDCDCDIDCAGQQDEFAGADIFNTFCSAMMPFWMSQGSGSSANWAQQMMMWQMMSGSQQSMYGGSGSSSSGSSGSYANQVPAWCIPYFIQWLQGMGDGEDNGQETDELNEYVALIEDYGGKTSYASSKLEKVLKQKGIKKVYYVRTISSSQRDQRIYEDATKKLSFDVWAPEAGRPRFYEDDRCSSLTNKLVPIPTENNKWMFINNGRKYFSGAYLIEKCGTKGAETRYFVGGGSNAALAIAAGLWTENGAEVKYIPLAGGLPNEYNTLVVTTPGDKLLGFTNALYTTFDMSIIGFKSIDLASGSYIIIAGTVDNLISDWFQQDTTPFEFKKLSDFVGEGKDYNIKVCKDSLSGTDFSSYNSGSTSLNEKIPIIVKDSDYYTQKACFVCEKTGSDDSTKINTIPMSSDKQNCCGSGAYAQKCGDEFAFIARSDKKIWIISQDADSYKTAVVPTTVGVSSTNSEELMKIKQCTESAEVCKLSEQITTTSCIVTGTPEGIFPFICNSGEQKDAQCVCYIKEEQASG